MLESLETVFCNVPWVEVHIDADGSYGTCGSQNLAKRRSSMLAEEIVTYNVANMSIEKWMDSDHQRKARLSKVNGVSEILCEMCYHEEEVSGQSKRTRENTKSNIERLNFYPSYELSPNKKFFDHSKFNDGENEFGKPNSFHMSLGNECNMMCKMCGPNSSSGIAAAQKKSGVYFGPIIQNWTTDDRVWHEVVDYIIDDENLQFVHIIGGEPLINPRFEGLMDKLIAANQTDIYFGFTTNGTIFSESVVAKLKKFRYVDIGISIETTLSLNNHIRQGSEIEQLKQSILRYLEHRNQLTITIRPVPSALSVHGLDSLYKWCIQYKIDIMTNILTNPKHLQIRNLPPDVKERLLAQYSLWQFSPLDLSPAHHRDSTRFKEHIDTSVRSVINSLNLPNDPEMTRQLYQDLSIWGWLSNSEVKEYFASSFNGGKI